MDSQEELKPENETAGPDPKVKAKTGDDEAGLTRYRDFIKRTKGGMDELEKDRAKIAKALNREPYGYEMKGRSSVVMSDVFDLKEWIKAAILPIFTGGQEVVELRPRGPEDEAATRLLEEKVNFDFEVNDGFTALHDYIDAALDQKIGWMKVWWLEEEKHITKVYTGLDDMELAALQSTPSFVPTSIKTTTLIDGQEAKVKPADMEFIAGMPGVSTTHDVEGYSIEKTTGNRFEAIPSEELVFDVYGKTLRECVHRKLVDKGELVKYGLKEEDLTAEVSRFESDPVYIERYADLGGIAWLRSATDKSKFYLNEYYYDDYDKEGNAKPLILTIVGDNIVQTQDNTYDEPPFYGMSSIRIAHRLVGRCHAELALDIQELHTAIVRYIMDNIYFQNNGMRVVNPYRIDANSLINQNKPGGIVFTKGDVDVNSAISSIAPSPLPGHITEMLDYARQIKENRTGVTGINPNPIPNPAMRTSGGISQVLSNIQQRIALLARVFAETGLKQFFTRLAKNNIKFMDEPVNIRLNGQWRSVMPEELSCRFDVMIDVGAGTGTKEYQFNQLSVMLDKYGQFGAANPQMAMLLISPKNVYNIFKTMWELQGRKNADSFITDPEKAMEAAGGPGAGAGIPGLNAQGGPGPADIGQPPIPGVLGAEGAGLPPALAGISGAVPGSPGA